VDRVVLRGEDGNLLKHPKYVVTFTEYGNTETVTLGEMDVPDGPFYREDTQKVHVGRVSGHQYRNDSRGGGEDLYEEVRRREQDKVTGSRGNYFNRIETTKNSLAGSGGGRGPPPDRRRRSPSPSRARKRPPPRDEGRSSQREFKRDEDRRSHSQSPPPQKRTAEEFAAIQEKKRKLLSKYG
jgi:pre-mRNA-splicing factor 38B